VETDAEAQQLEAWLNAGKSRVFINRYDAKGKIRQELIAPGKTFHLSTAERRLNQEMAANEKLDLFRNGMLQPVRLIEGTEDAQALTENPNLLQQGEEESIFKLHWRTFEKRIAEIDNITTLERILEAATGDATVRQINQIKARLLELTPAPEEMIRPDAGTGPVPGMPTVRPVTPH
jgi:hypothetical protein